MGAHLHHNPAPCQQSLLTRLHHCQAGVCALRGAAGAGVGRVARVTLAYYAATTAAAVALGVLLVVLVQPGAPAIGHQ